MSLRQGQFFFLKLVQKRAVDENKWLLCVLEDNDLWGSGKYLESKSSVKPVTHN